MKTNGDRIRTMTDEELANSEFAPIICDMVPAEWCYMGRSCYECRLAWLRSPVEDGEGNEKLLDDFGAEDYSAESVAPMKKSN